MSTAEAIDNTADTTAADIADALRFNDDTASPVLYCLRDALLLLPGATPAGALDAARVLLAAHAREMGTLVQQRIEQDRADNPKGAYGKHRRGGMLTARVVLDRYADDLDTAAMDGGS